MKGATITPKVALITAAGSGMGAAIARKLAHLGYKIAILSSSGRGEALAAGLGDEGLSSGGEGYRSQAEGNSSGDEESTFRDERIPGLAAASHLRKAHP